MRKTFVLVASATTSMLLLLLVQVAPGQAAPSRRPAKNTYDQRQDGKLNVHAKLENFLVVFAPSSAGGADLAGLLQNDLVLQAIQLKNVASRVAERSPNEDAEVASVLLEPADSRPETSASGINGREIEADEPNRRKLRTDGNRAQKPEASVKLVAIVHRDLPEGVDFSSQSTRTRLQQADDSKRAVNIETDEKTARSLARLSSESVVVSKLPPIAIDQLVDHPVNKVSKTRNKPGNFAGPADVESQEFKLIGDGIENCGPGRYRDSNDGICKVRPGTS